MTLILISFSTFFFTQHVIILILCREPLHCAMFDYNKELPEGDKLSLNGKGYDI